MFDTSKSVVQELELKFPTGAKLFIKREDLIHPVVSGNKYRKLKYNLEEANNLGLNTLLTFGGAFSNHIAATAEAARLNGMQSIGIIRGEELSNKIESNPTLKFARGCGMQLKFVSRSEYQNKDSSVYVNLLKREFGDFYMLPEGGTNALAVRGCEEILNDCKSDYEFICASVGTGGTLSGLINCSKPSQQVLGFMSLKGDFLSDEILNFANKDNYTLINDYHFGGYAKINEDLVMFINRFREDHGILLDPVYTGKMLFGIYDLIKKGYFKNDARILAIHTGGLQGISGMNNLLKKKKLPLIKV